MSFLASHWHCILLIALVGLGYLLLLRKPKDKEVDRYAVDNGKENA